MKLGAIILRKKLAKCTRGTKLVQAFRKKDTDIQVVATRVMALFGYNDADTLVNSACNTTDNDLLSDRRPRRSGARDKVSRMYIR